MQTRSMALGGPISQVAWPAIVAGVFIALASHIVLGFFSVALGTAAQAADSTALAVLGGIWGLLVPLVATFIGAVVAVRMARAIEAPSALLHGVLVWCIGIVAGAMFLSGTVAGAALTGGPLLRTQITPLGVQAIAGETAASIAMAGLAGLFGLLGGVMGAMSARTSMRESRRGAGTGPRMATPAEAPMRGERSERGDLEREGVLRTREPNHMRMPPRDRPSAPPSGDFTKH